MTSQYPPFQTDLKTSLIKLCNEAEGLLSYDAELRQVIGNTNFACLKLRVDEARAIIKSCI